MGMPVDEYRNRYNTIIQVRSIKEAASVLGIQYSTLGKWYHEHKEEFPPTVREAIKGNSGRTPVKSQREPWHYPTPEERRVRDERGISPEESWVIKEAEREEVEDLKAHGPTPASSLVDALFHRFSQLKDDNTRLFMENRALREKVSQLQGHTSALKDIQSHDQRVKWDSLVQDVHNNSYGARD